MANETILIVEDDLKIARVMKAYLEGAGFNVIHKERGADALSEARHKTPSLVLLDLMLPGISGEELIQELKGIGDFPIIMVSAKASEEERVAGFALGADDYIVKPFSPREMVWRVKAVLKRWGRNDLFETKSLSFNKGALVMDGQSYQILKNGNPIDLTPTEFKVLFTLAQSPGIVFSRDQLVESALGYHYEGYDRTVDAHIKNIRHKIEDDPRRPVFIMTVYGVGYRFSGKPDV